MKKEDIIKYALIAGGAYLAYVYLKNSGLWDQWFGVPAVAPATGTGTTPVSPVLVVDNTAKIAADAHAASANTTATIDDSKLMRAAANKAWVGEATGALLNWDEWNWYLAKYAVTNNVPAQSVVTAEDVGLTRPLSAITATQYHSLKAAKGLEGIGNIIPMLPYGRVWGGGGIN